MANEVEICSNACITFKESTNNCVDRTIINEFKVTVICIVRRVHSSRVSSLYHLLQVCNTPISSCIGIPI